MVRLVIKAGLAKSVATANAILLGIACVLFLMSVGIYLVYV